MRKDEIEEIRKRAFKEIEVSKDLPVPEWGEQAARYGPSEPLGSVRGGDTVPVPPPDQGEARRRAAGRLIRDVARFWSDMRSEDPELAGAVKAQILNILGP